MTRAARLASLLCLASALLAGCPMAAPDRAGFHDTSTGTVPAQRTPSVKAPPSSAPSTSRTSAPAAPHAALFQAEPRVRQLPLPDFQDVHLVLPRGDGTQPARLAVVAHGAGERPEPHCDHYAKLLGDSTLVACTRGFPQNRHLPEPERGYFYDGHHRLGAELTALLAALSSEAPYAGNVRTERAL